MASTTEQTLTERALIWSRQARLKPEPMFNGTDDPDHTFSVRLTPFKQPATNKYMYLGSGKTEIDAWRQAMQQVIAGESLVLDYGQRYKGGPGSNGSTASNALKPAF